MVRLPAPRITFLTGVLLALAAVAAAVLTWLALRPEAVPLAHAPYVSHRTAMKAVFCPAHVQGYVSRQAPGFLKAVPGIPKLSSTQPISGRVDWVHYLPLELTLLFEARTPGRLDVAFLIQEHEDGPSYARLLNNSPFFRYLRPIRFEGALRPQRENVLLAGGSVSVVDYPGGSPAPTRRLDKATGTHFFELLVDNADGTADEFHAALAAAHPQARGVQAFDALHDFWPAVDRLRFTADLVADDRFEMHIEAGWRPETEAGVRAQALDALDAAGVAVAAHLANAHGFRLTHTIEPAADGVTGAGALTGFESLLRRALGHD
ncbi:MAG: hypothetical protein ACLFTT_00600 [Candidatus Hydrogenedentota bacterium]